VDDEDGASPPARASHLGDQRDRGLLAEDNLSQILNYLRSAGGGVGLLMNFGGNPTVQRYVSGHPPISLPLLPKDPVKDISRWLATGDPPGADSPRRDL
jgi:hypothetical protein